MKLLLFEWLTGGGLWHDDAPLDSDCAMQQQGREMLLAIAEDFLSSGTEILLPIDSRFATWIPQQSGLQKRQLNASDSLETKLSQFAGEVDAIMLIAPESAGCLSSCIRWIAPHQDKLISPGSEFTRIAADKCATFRHLAENGFEQFPLGWNLGEYLDPGNDIKDFSLPAVIKPNDGAGSEGVIFVNDWSQVISGLSGPLDRFRVEVFVSGTPVSVSVLCGGQTSEILTPTIQVFDVEPLGHYLRAGYPVNARISERAIDLATEVVKAMPPTRGYIGMDMVIGDDRNAAWLIEVNPRLTMSYLKLREIYSENLAQQMLTQATQKRAGEIRSCTFLSPNP